jgi:peptide/nickel transport system permease protein
MIEREQRQTVLVAADNAETLPERRQRWFSLASTHRQGVVGASLLALVLLTAIFAPLLSPYDPNEPHVRERLAAIGTEGFILGTDGQGRDMLSRLIYGARSSLAMAILPVTIAGVVGLILGPVAGFFGRVVDATIMRTLDIFFGLPPIMLAILVAACLGPGLLNMIIALTIVLVPPMTRVAYQVVVTVRELPFIEAARASGARTHQIILHHVLPNILAPVVAYGASLSGLMIVFGAGLSFIGLGIQPPTADWGRMINDGRLVLPIAPHVATLPGLAIFAVATAFNLLGDSLRDALDPRLTV